MQAISKFIGILFIALVANIANSSIAFAQVASVFDLTGTATATAGVVPGARAAAGRMLRKGDTVNQGDAINTGANSTLVLRFEDGQVVALSANSNLKIDTYTYNRVEPAKSNVFHSSMAACARSPA